ncbi:hypothetical protein ACFW04_011686 [Cataglyphis niger]
MMRGVSLKPHRIEKSANDEIRNILLHQKSELKAQFIQRILYF